MRPHRMSRSVVTVALMLGILPWGVSRAVIRAGLQGAPPALIPGLVPAQIVAPTPGPPGRRVERSPIDGMPMLVSENAIEMPTLDDPVDQNMPVMPLPPHWR